MSEPRPGYEEQRQSDMARMVQNERAWVQTQAAISVARHFGVPLEEAERIVAGESVEPPKP